MKARATSEECNECYRLLHPADPKIKDRRADPKLEAFLKNWLPALNQPVMVQKRVEAEGPVRVMLVYGVPAGALLVIRGSYGLGWVVQPRYWHGHWTQLRKRPTKNFINWPFYRGNSWIGTELSLVGQRGQRAARQLI